jgi:hypothetical protein
MRLATCAALLCIGALAGCGKASNQLLGVPPTLQQSNLVADERVQDAMVTSLAHKASLETPLPAIGPHWRAVAEAGIVEVDIQCDRYLAALFTFNREQRAGRQILTATGAGTAAILGITGAAGTTIALVAAAFGLAANIFDAGADSVLYTISPTAVRAVAAKGRQAYLAGIKWEAIDTRPRMMMVVQGYLAQCTPAAIEANIDNAATGAPSVANVDTALKAAALAAPASAVVQDPKIFLAAPVAPPSPIRPFVQPSDVPGHVAAVEQPFILSKQDVMHVQTALGVGADGDLGPAGASTPGETRRAIIEFRTGVLRRADKPGAASDVLDQDTFEILRRAGPMPKDARTAFERGMLYSRASGYTAPDPVGFGMAIEALSGAPPSSADGLPAALREAIKARRNDPAAPDTLDSDLYNRVHPLQ